MVGDKPIHGLSLFLDHDWKHDPYNFAHQCHHRLFLLPLVYTNNWTKLGAVFQKGAAGKFDDTDVAHPSVLKVGDYFYLFYCGNSTVAAEAAIGVARFTDPEGTYSRLNDGNPILDVDASYGYFCPSAIYDDYAPSSEKWKLWIFKTLTGETTRQILYSYSVNPDSGWSTPTVVFDTADDPWWGHAVVKCGRLYLFFVPKYADLQTYLYVSSSPSSKGDSKGVVIPRGGTGAWDSGQTRYVGVTYINGVLYAMYSGFLSPTLKIGLVLGSPDLTNTAHYNKYTLNPVIPNGATGQPDETHAFSPCLLQVNEKFYCWYTGVNPTDRKICLARIP